MINCFIIFLSSKRSVPSVSFTLHSVHCRRFMKVCEKCEEPIPITQIEEHNIDVHSLIQCLECQQQIEKGSKDSHNVSIYFLLYRITPTNLVI